MMKILICGSRNWTDREAIFEVIHNHMNAGDILIAGAARGADKIAEEIAGEHKGIFVESYPAQWGRFGKRAGYVRNIEMLNQNPDIVYAFPLGKSVGTWHTINEARKRGIKTIVYGEK